MESGKMAGAEERKTKGDGDKEKNRKGGFPSPMEGVWDRIIEEKKNEEF